MSERSMGGELDPADAQAVAAAVARTRRWTLTTEDWQRATAALGLIEDAVIRGDRVALRDGLSALAECGPRRVATLVTSDLASAATSPAPHSTVELANRIEHSLGVSDEDNG